MQKKKTNSNLKNIENELNAIFYSEKFQQWLQNLKKNIENFPELMKLGLRLHLINLDISS